MRARDAFAAAAFVAMGALAAPIHAEARACVRAAVEEPFLLPDGSWHRAGLLRICLDRAYSPVSALHTVAAGDGGASTFMSRRATAEFPAELPAPRILFARHAGHTLTLLGYAIAARGRTEVYWVR